MKELQNMIAAIEQSKHTNQRTAIATVVKTSGSVYRRAGARMLLTESGQTIGAISGGCLESDVFERAKEVMLDQDEPIVVQYDTTSSDDIVWGLGLGCNGVVHVLIEFLSDTARSQLDFIAECFAQNQPGVIATIFQVRGETQIKVAQRLLCKQDGTVITNIVDSAFAQKVHSEAQQVLHDGRSCVKSYLLSNGVAEVLLEVIQPPVELLLFGAGHDAIPVVHFAKQLGWQVTVIDHRLSYATGDRFPNADRIILCNPQDLEAHITLHSGMVAVVMTHKYLHDLALLRTLLLSPLRYLGMLGPKTRQEGLLQNLEASGCTPTLDQLSRLYGPVGLDIGADTPEEIALSIVAEIQAVIANRCGNSLRERAGSIHRPSKELICPVSA